MLSLEQGESMTIFDPIDSSVPCDCPCGDPTNSEVRTYKLKWVKATGNHNTSVKNWVMRNEFELDEPIKSPSFCLGKGDEIEACIVFYPRGVGQRSDASSSRSAGDDKCVSLYLQEIAGFYETTLLAKLEFEIKFSEVTKREMMMRADNQMPKVGWGFAEMQKRTSKMYCDLEVTCTISMYYKKPGQASSSNIRVTTPTQKLQYNMRALYSSGTFADVQVVTCDGILSAHKNILSARSPVFAAMLSTDMREGNSNVIDIVDFDIGVIDDMLLYVYTGEVKNIRGMGEDLLMAADKYDLSDLKHHCETSLAWSLTIENASNRYRVASLCRSDHLQNKTKAFIRRHSTEVKLTDGWKMLVKNCVDLALDMF